MVLKNIKMLGHTNYNFPSYTNNTQYKQQLSFRGNGTTQVVLDTAKYCSSMGQIQSDFFKAMGKAVITPIFILKNPFIQNDKNGRNLTALMQPIEATLCFMFSTSINLLANKIIEPMAKNNYFGEYFNPLKNKEAFNIFQNRMFFLVTFLSIPLLSLVLNRLLPNIVNSLKKPEKKHAYNA